MRIIKKLRNRFFYESLALNSGEETRVETSLVS